MRFSLFFFANGSESSAQYRLLLDAARYADKAGFDAVWTPERHFHEFGAPFPNPAVTGAAVAAVTERIDVRAGSVVLPLHDTLRVAEEWAVVDQISGGRAGIAFASGWNPNDFVLAPGRYTDNKSRMREGIAELRRLWQGQEVERKGPAGEVRRVRTYPQPSRGDIPLWITAAGNPETFGWAGDQGLGVLTHLLGQSWDQLEDNLVSYSDALARSGRPITDERVAVMLHTLLFEHREEAVETAKAPLMEYMRSSMSLFGLKDPAAAPESVPQSSLREMLEHAYHEYVDTRCLVGSVESCMPVVEALSDLGVDEIACLIDFGVDPRTALEQLSVLDELRRACADL